MDNNGKNILAMSFYPKEGNPLWERYSTKLVAHTLKVYSKYTIDYPYPVAISVHTKWMGMEYPMICFNGGRPNEDGTYSEQKKYSMWGVIIHEVGHNFFPMIINSDERQWTWMDEGLNTFVQYLTEQEWERNYPSKRGPANKIVNYMSGDKNNISPIMTNSESILQFGNNSYGKPATALNILRETVMGRELFDYSFKVYCERWKFKHPTPADFFRTMEDASSVDLDWFWRGWFYSTDNVDISLSNVKQYITDSIAGNKKVIIEEKVKELELKQPQDITIGTLRNLESISTTLNEKDTSINDHYGWKRKSYNDSILEFAYNEDIHHVEYDIKTNDSKYYYELTFNNIGGLVSPIIIRAFLEDGTTEIVRIPAEIWLKNDKEVSKVFVFKNKVIGFRLDPFLETADTNLSNNVWPAKKTPSRYKIFMQNKK